MAAREPTLHIVPPGTTPERLDRYAARVLPDVVTVSHAHKAARRGSLTLNGATVEPCRRVRPGDRVLYSGPAQRLLPPLAIPIPVEYQDPWLAVVLKPPGLPVSGNVKRSVERALPLCLPPSPLPDALQRAQPVHRLDNRTGGLLMVARTTSSRAALGKALELRMVTKRYRTLVIGRLEGEGEVREPVDGREAVTRWRAVAHGPSLRTRWLTTVDAWPVTGRTHQVRRHMAALGHPVLGDDIYGIPGTILKGQGLFLWAVALTFPHPSGAGSVHLQTPEPPRFGSHLSRERRRWCRWHGPEQA